jgi:elongation factor G
MDNRNRYLIDTKIEPKIRFDRERLKAVLTQMAIDNVDFGYEWDKVRDDMMIAVPDEETLVSYLESLASLHHIEVVTSAPQVRYHEALRSSADADYTHKRASGSFEFARVRLRLEPGVTGAGNTFSNEVIGSTIPHKFIPAVEKGARSALAGGVLVGFPIIDTDITVLDGAYHEVDSSAQAFEAAAHEATREAATKAGLKLLEPVMDLDVTTPGAFVGIVLGDIFKRRGQVLRQKMRGEGTAIIAKVPLANLFGYKSAIHSLSQGKAHCAMSFSHYEVVSRRDDGPDNFPPAVGMRA